MTIQIAQRSALELPLDFVTERIAFLARTGAGKRAATRRLRSIPFRTKWACRTCIAASTSGKRRKGRRLDFPRAIGVGF